LKHYFTAFQTEFHYTNIKLKTIKES
jgi:hypothetical protein